MGDCGLNAHCTLSSLGLTGGINHPAPRYNGRDERRIRARWSDGRENNENGSTKLLKRLIGAPTMHFRAVSLNKNAPNDANCKSGTETEGK